MITTGDIYKILYKKCGGFGFEVYRYGHIPRGEVENPRVTIKVKAPNGETYWRKGFAEVNILFPNIGESADLTSLEEYEHLAEENLTFTEVYDGLVVRFSVDGRTEIIEDASLRCYYVNARVLYEVLNVK